MSFALLGEKLGRDSASELRAVLMRGLGQEPALAAIKENSDEHSREGWTASGGSRNLRCTCVPDIGAMPGPLCPQRHPPAGVWGHTGQPQR